jgi:hypothetical protein
MPVSGKAAHHSASLLLKVWLLILLISHINAIFEEVGFE